jgi:hypothetical protein
VQLNIANSVLPLDKLANTPSSLDGMSAEVRQNSTWYGTFLPMLWIRNDFSDPDPYPTFQ